MNTNAGRPTARSPRPLPVIVLADVSGSMAKDELQDKIGVLNRSIAAMFASFAREDSVRGEIHVAVVTFGGEDATLHLPMVPATAATWTDMEASGRTPMGAAFDLTRALLEDTGVVPERAFYPTIVLVSDGVPTDDWEEPLNQLLATKRGARAIRVAVGIGSDRTPDADEVLRTFSSPGVDVMRADQVDHIAAFFNWVTVTVAQELRTGRSALRLEDLDQP
jgi:uncharacterized protein YegL